MAVTNSEIKRFPAVSVRHGYGIFYATADASGAEDVTFDISELSTEDPVVLGTAMESAAGGATVGVKSSTNASFVLTTSAAGSPTVYFLLKIC